MHKFNELLESVDRLVLGKECRTKPLVDVSALQSQLRRTQERMDVLRLKMGEYEEMLNSPYCGMKSYHQKKLYEARHEYEDAEREYKKLSEQLGAAQAERVRGDSSREDQEEHTCNKCHTAYQCDSKQFQRLTSLVEEANRLAAEHGYSERLDETSDVCKKCLRGFLFDLSRAIKQKVSECTPKITRKETIDEDETQKTEANLQRLKKLALPNGEYDIWLVEKKLKDYSRWIRIKSRSLSMEEP